MQISTVPDILFPAFRVGVLVQNAKHFVTPDSRFVRRVDRHFWWSNRTFVEVTHCFQIEQVSLFGTIQRLVDENGDRWKWNTARLCECAQCTGISVISVDSSFLLFLAFFRAAGLIYTSLLSLCSPYYISETLYCSFFIRLSNLIFILSRSQERLSLLI